MKLLTSIAILLVHTSVFAQDGANKKPAESAASTQAPAEDPFKRGPGDPVSDAQMKSPNFIVVNEVWSLRQVDFLALQDASINRPIAYDRVRELAKMGKARLRNVTAGTQKSDRQLSIQSVDEVRYPVNFDQPEANQIPFPTDKETRNVGDMLESQLTLGIDGKTCELAASIREARLAGVRELRAEPSSIPAPGVQFDASECKFTTQLRLGRPSFVGTITNQAELLGPEAEILIAFTAVYEDNLSAGKPTAATDSQEARIDVMLFRLDRSSAQSILSSSHTAEGIYEQARAAFAKGDAKLERTTSLVSKSNQQGVQQQGSLVPRLIEAYPPQIVLGKEVKPEGKEGAETAPRSTLARLVAGPGSFETCLLGSTIEVNPTISEDGTTIDLEIACKLTQDRGVLKMPAAFARFPAESLIEERSISTVLTAQNGKACFLGTMNLPRANGVNDRKDTEETVLAFVRATVVNP